MYTSPTLPSSLGWFLSRCLPSDWACIDHVTGRHWSRDREALITWLLWEHNLCWSWGQLCNNGSHSRITTVSGLWLATTLPALFKVTVLGDTLISFYTGVLHWVPWGLVCWAGASRWVERTWELLKAAVPGWASSFHWLLSLDDCTQLMLWMAGQFDVVHIFLHPRPPSSTGFQLWV